MVSEARQAFPCRGAGPQCQAATSAVIWPPAARRRARGNAQRRAVARDAISSKRTSAEKRIPSGCSLRPGTNSLSRPFCPSPDSLHALRCGGRRGYEMRRRRPAAAPPARTGARHRESRRPRIGMLWLESPCASGVFETHTALPAPPHDARRCAGSRLRQPTRLVAGEGRFSHALWASMGAGLSDAAASVVVQRCWKAVCRGGNGPGTRRRASGMGE